MEFLEFPGGSRKNHVEFPGVLVLGLKFLRGVTQFCGVSRGEDFFFLEFPEKVKSLKILRGFQTSMSFSGTAHYLFRGCKVIN